MVNLTDIHKMLIEKQKTNQQVMQSAIEKLKKIQEPGRLRIGHTKGYTQYYQCADGFGDRGKYLRKKDKKLISTLADKDYYKKIIQTAQSQKDWIEETLRKIPKEDLHEIYEGNSERRKLISPYFLTDEEYIRKWENVEYTGKGFEEGSAEIYTEKGERVRSKSEKIIADKLYKMHLPYRYEYPLKLKGFGTIYPDFTILNVRTRKEIILEHFGMMDNPQYCSSALDKLSEYTMNGYFLGENLIISYETSVKPIDTKNLQKIIERYFD